MSHYTQNKLAEDPNHVWAKMLTIIPDGSEVLDVGCSSGNFGEELQHKKHCLVDGVEPDAGDAKLAAKKLRKVWAFSIEDEKNIEQIQRTYDVIIFADVLEHLVQPAKVLESIKKLLKKDGMVVFSVPNMAHVSVRLALLEGVFEYTEVGLLDKTHLHFYDLPAVYDLFKEAGMKLEQLDASSFEYSDLLIKKRLEAIGFKPTAKGNELLHSAEAAAFQYIGKATVAAGPPAKLRPTTQAVAKDVQALTNEIAENKKVITRLNDDITVLRNHIDTISDQLQKLAASKAYRLGNVLVGPVRLAKTLRKRG
ncbi:MAG TPA: class I SAM-dependent methyltransferase [Candidatus Saccharimonadales bacterium]|nr:class I SAM-dependent methyltransferase [Candidatus Saccharimonadales bacterium]